MDPVGKIPSLTNLIYLFTSCTKQFPRPEISDKMTAQAGQLGNEPLKNDISADASAATLASPEHTSEIVANKEAETRFDDKSIQLNDLTNEKLNVDAADAKDENGSQNSTEEWRFTRRAQLVFATLATLSLMVALDGTSISVALPVCVPIPSRNQTLVANVY